MKKIVLSAVAVVAMSSFALAGGDIAPVEEPVVVPEPVVTDSGFYLGLAYSNMNATSEVAVGGYINGWDVDAEYSLFDESISTGMLQAGYKFNSYVAVEGRYWFGGSETVAHVADAAGIGRDVDLDIDSFGIYVKPMYPVTDAFDIYALLGYASNGYELSAITTAGDVELNPDVDVDGFSWGIGAAYSFTDNLSVFVDYTVLYDDENDYNAYVTVEDKIDSVNVGLTYQF